MTEIGITNLTLDAIRAEAIKAITKHGAGRTPADPHMTNGGRLAILTEELGEVARAMTYDQDPLNLERELIQVAAMAAMWIDGLNPAAGIDGYGAVAAVVGKEETRHLVHPEEANAR